MQQDPNIIIPKIAHELIKIGFTFVPSLLLEPFIFSGVAIVGTQVLDWGSLLEVIGFLVKSGHMIFSEDSLNSNLTSVSALSVDSPSESTPGVVACVQ